MRQKNYSETLTAKSDAIYTGILLPDAMLPAMRRRDMADLLYVLFSFSGRINRMTYLYGLAIQILIVVMVVACVIAAADTGLGVMLAEEQLAAFWAVPFSILMTWITLAMSTKRFHDRNMSGWWYLVTFIPLLGAIWWAVHMIFLPGTDGPNDYGPPHSSEPEAAHRAGDGLSRARPDAPFLGEPVGAPSPVRAGGRQPGFGRRGI